MKSKISLILAVLFLFVLPLSAFGQITEAIKPAFNSIQKEDLEAQLSFIASDYTEGRETTSRGYDLAAKYAASLFKMWGLEPGGDWRTDYRTGKRTRVSYFQTVPFEHIIKVENAWLKVKTDEKGLTSEKIFNNRVDFSLNTSSSMNISADVVFVGYGLTEDDFNDFKKVDVKNKVVLMISGIPGDTDKESEFYKKYRSKRRGYRWYRSLLNKIEEEGAIGVLFAPSSASEVPTNIGWNKNKPWRNPRRAKHYEGDEPMESRPDLNLITGEVSDTNPFNIRIPGKVASALLKTTGKTLEELQKEIDSKQKSNSFLIKNTNINIGAIVKSEILNCKNVVGYVEGSDPKLKEELVVVGAHLDHVGKRSGMIFNGADDDGSGCAGVMEMAEAFAILKEKPKRTVVFCLWTGEEHGLCGSRYFVGHPLKPKENIVFYLNFDMIGRNDQDKEENKDSVRCSISKEAPELEEINENNMKLIDNLGVRLSVRYNISGGTDYTYFSRNGIPVQGFITGFHPDYHQITDHVDKINFEKMERIVKLGFLNLHTVANMKTRLKYEKHDSPQ